MGLLVAPSRQTAKGKRKEKKRKKGDKGDAARELVPGTLVDGHAP
jgi:hypothetical protein